MTTGRPRGDGDHPGWRAEPLAPGELRAAAASCARPGEALGVLVLPVAALPAQLVRVGDTWQWRGDVEATSPGRDAEALAALVERNHRDSDRYIDPAAPRWSWVHPVASGWATLAVGFAEVLGGPQLSAERSLGDRAVHAMAREVDAGAELSPPSVLELAGTPALLSGDGARWHLGASTAPAQAPTSDVHHTTRLASVAARLAADLGTDVVVDATHGPEASRLAAHVDGWDLEFDVGCHLGATSVGPPARDVSLTGAPDGTVAPPGCAVVGVDGSALVVETASGYRGRARRR